MNKPKFISYVNLHMIIHTVHTLPYVETVVSVVVVETSDPLTCFFDAFNYLMVFISR